MIKVAKLRQSLSSTNIFSSVFSCNSVRQLHQRQMIASSSSLIASPNFTRRPITRPVVLASINYDKLCSSDRSSSFLSSTSFVGQKKCEGTIRLFSTHLNATSACLRNFPRTSFMPYSSYLSSVITSCSHPPYFANPKYSKSLISYHSLDLALSRSIATSAQGFQHSLDPDRERDPGVSCKEERHLSAEDTAKNFQGMLGEFEADESSYYSSFSETAKRGRKGKEQTREGKEGTIAKGYNAGDGDTSRKRERDADVKAAETSNEVKRARVTSQDDSDSRSEFNTFKDDTNDSSRRASLEFESESANAHTSPQKDGNVFTRFIRSASKTIDAISGVSWQSPSSDSVLKNRTDEKNH